MSFAPSASKRPRCPLTRLQGDIEDLEDRQRAAQKQHVEDLATERQERSGYGAAG